MNAMDLQHDARPVVLWRNDLTSAQWDAALAQLGGHVLQSALFGDARSKHEGIKDERWIAFRADAPLWMIRIEHRNAPLLGTVCWAPRGPTENRGASTASAFAEFRGRLKERGFSLLVTDRWQPRGAASQEQTSGAQTIWLDLTGGRDAVWAGVHKGWRYDVRNAKRLGVETETSHAKQDIETFHALCREVSKLKKFNMSVSLAMITDLLRHRSEQIEAVLLIAKIRGEFAGGAVILRCGTSAHYFWGASDRRFRKECIGQAVQWAAVEWAVSSGCTLYDLEGIDPVANPGTFAFKSRMGGRRVALVGKEYFPYDLRGRALAWLDERR
jgi:hypothetical protein